MEHDHHKKKKEPKKDVLHVKGVTFFDRKTERKFFFVLTLIMLLLGVLAKLGLF
jgi:hypothetical protein